jgi:hypothetical protein
VGMDIQGTRTSRKTSHYSTSCTSTSLNSTGKHINIMYTNADSLRNKLDELKFKIENNQHRPHKICLTEYKQKVSKSFIDMCEYNLEGHNMYRDSESAPGTGVIIYVDEI